VKKARAWLTQQGVDYAFWDYKKHGVPAGKLSHWLGALGWQRVVNTRGTAWRQLPASTQASVVDAPTAAPVLLASPSVIKRPIVAWGNTYAQTLTVGFDEDIWQGIIKI
jgi:Spx/MgsR family transcriptional regulator